MANFDVQIQALAGDATQTEMDQWMNDGVRELINLFPLHIKEMCYTKVSFTSQDAGSESETINTHHIGNVFAGSVECRAIHPKDKYKASSGITAASATDPVYYIEGGKINVLPSGSSRDYYIIADPSIDASTASAISNFPNEAEYLVVLYAAIKVLQNKMNEKSISLPDDIILPNIPEAPSISENFVSITGNAPTYSKDSFILDFPDANNWLNTEEDSEMVASRVQIIQTQLQEYQVKISEELNKFNKENVEYQSLLQKNMQDAQMSDSKEGRDLQKYGQELQSYQAEVSSKMQDYMNKINKISSDYQWLQSQHAQLKQDYVQGVQLLTRGGVAPQKEGGE